MNKLVYEYLIFIINSKNINISDIDKRILENIKNDKIDILNSNTNDISKALFFSKSSLTRFAKKLCYNGFSELKYDLVQKVKKNPHSIIDITYKDMINNISLPDKLIDLIKNLKKFRKIRVFGIGTSGLAAREYNYRLNEFHLNNINSADEPYNQVIEANNLNENDLVIALSISGQNSNIIDIVNLSIKKGAIIWGISANESSKLKELSNYFIKIPMPTKNISKIFPLIYLLDLICYYLQDS